MCDTVFTTNLAPYISGSIGLIGVYAGYRLALANIKRQEFNKAAAEFLCAFTNELGTITDMERGDAGGEIETLLSNAYPQHRNAFLRFSVYLGKSERETIEKEWENYCYGEILPGEDRLPERFNQYNIEQLEEARQLALNNINRLLTFAKLK
jgi:hypothetical protein